MAKQDDEKAIAREARQEAELKVTSKENEKKADFLERSNRKLAKAYDQALSEPNTVQILTGTMTAVGTAGGAFVLNRKIRKKLREKGWVNEKNERSMANIAVADGLPIVVGLGTFIGGCFIKNGVVSSVMCGVGGGLVGGTIISAATADETTP